MKKTLLLLVMISVITGAFAQKRKKTEQPLTGYAITAVEKGGRSWKEVRLVNITTGEEIRSIYQSKQETEAFNARTGNPVVKKDMTVAKAPVKKIVNLDQELAAANGSNVRVKTVVVNNNAATNMINHLQQTLRRWLMIKNMNAFIIRQWVLTSFAILT